MVGLIVGTAIITCIDFSPIFMALLFTCQPFYQLPKFDLIINHYVCIIRMSMVGLNNSCPLYIITKKPLWYNLFVAGYRAEFGCSRGGSSTPSHTTGFSQNGESLVKIVRYSRLCANHPAKLVSLVLLDSFPSLIAGSNLKPSLWWRQYIITFRMFIKGCKKSARVDSPTTILELTLFNLCRGLVFFDMASSAAYKCFPNVLLKRYRRYQLACHRPQCHFEP